MGAGSLYPHVSIKTWFMRDSKSPTTLLAVTQRMYLDRIGYTRKSLCSISSSRMVSTHLIKSEWLKRNKYFPNQSDYFNFWTDIYWNSGPSKESSENISRDYVYYTFLYPKGTITSSLLVYFFSPCISYLKSKKTVINTTKTPNNWINVT